MQKAHGRGIHHFISKRGNSFRPRNPLLGVFCCSGCCHPHMRRKEFTDRVQQLPWTHEAGIRQPHPSPFSAPSWAGTHTGHAGDLAVCICSSTASPVTWTLCFPGPSPSSKEFKGTHTDHVRKSCYYSRYFWSSAMRKFIITICRMQQVKNVKSRKARAEAVSGELSKRNVLLWNEVWVNRSVETELLGQEETHFMQRH